MQQRREQLLEELRIAEQARDLLRELEHNLSDAKGPEFARRVRQLEQLHNPCRRLTSCGW